MNKLLLCTFLALLPLGGCAPFEVDGNSCIPTYADGEVRPNGLHSCGNWLSQTDKGEGFVDIRIEVHPICCSHPARTIYLDEVPITPPPSPDSASFRVEGPAGPHVVGVVELCPTGCSTCSTLEVTIP